MPWMYRRPEEWEWLSTGIIDWTKSPDMEECLIDAGYVPAKSQVEEGGIGLGLWRLYARVSGDARLPDYYLLVDTGNGTYAEVWLTSFGDLMCWLSRYGFLGKNLLKDDPAAKECFEGTNRKRLRQGYTKKQRKL